MCSHLGQKIFTRYTKLPTFDVFENFATIGTFSSVRLFVCLLVPSFVRSSFVRLFLHSLVQSSVPVDGSRHEK